MNIVNNKAIITRLILQKIIASDAVHKYVTQRRREELMNIFLTVSEKELIEKCERFHISFALLNSQKSSYYNDIAAIDVQWSLIKDGIMDADGNLWRSEKVNISFNISSDYGLKYEKFLDRLNCLNNVSQLIESISDLIVDPIATMTHTNEQRLEKEKNELYEKTCSLISEIVHKRCNKKNMRVGSVRWFAASHFDGLNLSPNKYIISYNEGNARRPRYKRYTLIVDPKYSAYRFTRTA